MQNQPYTLQFEQGGGYVVVVPGDGIVQFIVSAKNLKGQNYEIVLVDQSDTAVMFGEGNVHVHIGERHGETSFSPVNEQLLVWSLHPQRLVHAVKEGRIVIRAADGDHAEIARSQVIANPSQ